jgi:predicted DNA-binding protein (MmcQ/YjbR family)
MAKTLQGLNDELREFALGMPGAYEEFPWGERVAKVNKKVFVFLGKENAEAAELCFSVKLPASAGEVLELPYAEPTGYGLGKSGWVTIRLTKKKQPPFELLMRWIEESYRAVAPKKLIAPL